LEKDLLNIRYISDYYFCNFGCEYCIVGHGNKNGEKFPNMDEDLCGKIIENITKLPYKINIRLGVAGELFLNQFLISMAQKLSLSENIISVNLITNLSLKIEKYEKIFENFNRDKISIVASFHPTEVKDVKSWLNTAKYINKNYDFSVCLVAFPKFLNELSSYKKMLNDEGIDVFIQPFIGEWEGKYYPRDYSIQEQNIIRKNIYSRHDWEFLMENKKPGLCNAGFKSIFVNSKGVVFPCGEYVYENSIGDFSKSPEIKLNSSPMQCPALTCQCDTENMNTVIFEKNYKFKANNQHKYQYRMKKLSKFLPHLDEWKINYP
jgi:MoaA/NifB/PqqE/SkfB family radical SAM enzyme